MQASDNPLLERGKQEVRQQEVAEQLAKLKQRREQELKRRAKELAPFWGVSQLEAEAMLRDNRIKWGTESNYFGAQSGNNVTQSGEDQAQSGILSSTSGNGDAVLIPGSPAHKALCLEILNKHWGYSEFRGIQYDIITSICQGRDTLGLMPTGGGKSVTFQLPSLLMKGVCVVITPLIALMKDQVAHLDALGIRATAIYSGMTRSEILTSLDNCILGDYKFLYISPERLTSDLFQSKLAHMTVNFITVDEAHCISQWGYDFRPSYLNISIIRQLKPEAPILALTATATPKVVDDIQRQLHFSESNVHRMSFERKNLTYSVVETNNKPNALLRILEQEKGSAIVYTRNREQTREIARMLTDNGVMAYFYHAKLGNEDKDTRQEHWQNDLVRVMVCTNAFGMGIDKPDVRLVVHVGVPDSLEAYFQEAGRAGRDGQPAKAILLKGPYDVGALKRHINTAFPTKDFIRQVYENLCFYYQLAVGDGDGMRRELDLQDFCHIHKYFSNTVLSAFRILEHGGYLMYTEPEDSVSCVKIVVNRSDLYRTDNLPPDCETVLQALMRNYNGLFADLMPIQETILAQRTGQSPEEVYKNLRMLNMMGVIYYIPFKHIAHITFLQSRVETKDVVFSNEVYERRRMELVERVGAMINYLNSQTTCRSRLLLEYFGQTDGQDCGRCDNCLRQGHTHRPTTTQQAAQAQEKIVELLGDGHQHSYTELMKLNISPDILRQALEALLNEGEIEYNNGIFTLG